MSRRVVLACVLCVMLFSGCETCKGVKKDFQNLVNSFQDPDSPIRQADDWTRENLW